MVKASRAITWKQIVLAQSKVDGRCDANTRIRNWYNGIGNFIKTSRSIHILNGDLITNHFSCRKQKVHTKNGFGNSSWCLLFIIRNNILNWFLAMSVSLFVVFSFITSEYHEPLHIFMFALQPKWKLILTANGQSRKTNIYYGRTSINNHFLYIFSLPLSLTRTQTTSNNLQSVR